MRRALPWLILAGLALAQYKDVTPDRPEWQAVQALSEMGVLYGYPDGLFRPDRPVVRKELAMALYSLWRRAKEQNDLALQELSKKMAEAVLSLSRGQALLEDRLKALEEGGLAPEELEELRAEVASLRTAFASLEEGLSLLTDQYYLLAKDLGEVKARVAEVDQRSLAWNEDAVLLSKAVGVLDEAIKDLNARLQALDNSLTLRLREAEGKLQSGAASAQEALRSQIASQVEELRGSLGEFSNRLASLEELLTKTREEVFRLAEDLKKTKAELLSRVDRLERTPPPLAVGLTASGFSPLVLAGHVAHDNLLGLGLRLGVDYNAGTGEFLIQALPYLPAYRYPANASLGFGLSYALTGPYSGLAEVVSLVGLGLEVAGGIEGYGEARFLFPLDGSPSRARIGVGLRLRLGGF